MHTISNIIIGKTKFSIISEKNIKPESIIASNSFSGQKFTLGYNDIDAVVANKFNKVIFSEIFKKKKNDLLEFSNQEASSFSIILHAYSYITYSIIGGFYFFKSNIRMND